ncbi:unnamed protein product, partial [marine sediment metagenome]
CLQYDLCLICRENAAKYEPKLEIVSDPEALTRQSVDV